MPMDKAAYHEWAMGHVYAFGLGESGETMASAWFSIFNGFGYTIAELRAATLAMAKEPPQFPSEHLQRINESVAAGRQVESRRQWAGELGTCVVCNDGGYVVVPHPRYVVNGQWTERHTAAVVCGCWRGRRIMERNKNRREAGKDGDVVKPPMLLSEYERLNPNWKRQLDEYEIALADYSREVGPRRGEESRWATLDDAIDRAMMATKRKAEGIR